MIKVEDVVIERSMSIILNAGDARLACTEALEAIADEDFELANSKIKEAQKKITLAHTTQTDSIQDEARGLKGDYCVLFAHAQDTLMTINSEINITKQLIKIFKKYSEKFDRIGKE